MISQILTPADAVERLIQLHTEATTGLKDSLEHFFATREAPSPEERRRFCYPELRVTYEANGVMPSFARAYAKFQGPGVYSTTVTQPAHFRRYLTEQLSHLARDCAAVIEVAPSQQEIPYPYVLESGNDLGGGGLTAAELSLHFPSPRLAHVGDEIADGDFTFLHGGELPLALFDAVRTDYSLKRLQHYTGSDWRHTQPWILLTNYHRYVDQFLGWARAQLSVEGPYESLHLPGNKTIARGMSEEQAAAIVDETPWHKFQMPAYHLKAKDGHGVTLVNIGVGPSNAKNMTDHLAVLRPNCWLMIGHCGGLRQSQRIGDYVLAHGYLRQDGILDKTLPPEIPVPALAEVQVALHSCHN